MKTEDSAAGVRESSRQCQRCGGLAQTVDGLCVHCSLNEALQAEGEASGELFGRCLAEDEIPEKPWRLGNYEILQEIGRGGMGAVYLARRADAQYEKRVAIKLIKRGMDSDAVIQRFRKERQILAGFDHPNIARLFDAGTTENGAPYFVMEYIEGLPIDEYCDKHALNVGERLKLFLQVCAAVSYAHRHLVVHRDIKRSNILVTTEGAPKLLDFGIAKLLQQGDARPPVTITGLRPMTPEYASPEQVRGDPVTAASDVYSLGLVLYELLTGQSPYRFTSRSPHEVARTITETEPARPSLAAKERNSTAGIRHKTDSRALRGDLDNVLLMALRKEPSRRYQSVEQFSEDIRRHLEGRPVLARKDRLGYRSGKFVRRNRVAVIALTLGLFVAIQSFRSRKNSDVPARSAPSGKSIAVLPFENLSDDKGNAYFADGIEDEILTRLARVADLKVISRTSTQRFKSRPGGDLPVIAKQLGVAHILEGSAQRINDQVRVNVKLINAANDTHVWAETYDRKLDDVFAVETEIATKIADSLRAKLTGAEHQAIVARPTENMEAHELYLKARYFAATRNQDDLERAIDYYNQALTKDPNYAAAYAGLANTYLLSREYMNLPPVDALPKARTAAAKALELDNTLGEAHAALGLVLSDMDFNYRDAKREFERAIELNPNSTDAHYFFAMCVLAPRGEFDRAIAETRHAIALDPFSAIMNANLGYCYILARRYSEAIEHLRATVELNPDFPLSHGYLAQALWLHGNKAEAIAEFEKALEINRARGQLGEYHPLTYLSYVQGMDGDREKAVQLANEAHEVEQRAGAVWAWGYALVQIGLGDKERAIDWLEQSYRRRETGVIVFIRTDPLLDPLRGSSRFEALAEKIVPFHEK